jgi:hypothetical protein
VNGAADKPRKARKPQACPPGVGFIRWLCGAERQASSGWQSAAPLSRPRQRPSSAGLRGFIAQRPLERSVSPAAAVSPAPTFDMGSFFTSPSLNSPAECPWPETYQG